MSELFELHIYTMGSRSYAEAVVKLFDQDGRLFYDRILSRDDTGSGLEHRKNLRRIFPTDDRTVLVIDDRVDVWEYSKNLIPVPPCKGHHWSINICSDTFFIGTGDINRYGPPTKFLKSSAEDKDKDRDEAPPGVEDHADAVIADDNDQELFFIQTVSCHLLDFL
jgi:RNA polymerase II subunit A-like phosphatase